MSELSLSARIARLTTSQRTILADRITRQRGTQAGKQHLCAWFTADTDIPTEQLQASLAERLPLRMRPRHLMQVDRLPRTSSGKLDRRRLSECAAVVATDNRPSTAQDHSDGELPQIRKIWRHVLGHDVDSEADFFASGGDSLDVIRVLALMSEAGLRMTPAQFAEHPTLAAQSTWLRRAKPADERPAESSESAEHSVDRTGGHASVAAARKSTHRGNMIYLSEQNTRPALFFLPPKCRAAAAFEHIVAQIRNYNCYCPVVVGENTEDTAAVEDVVPEFLQQIRRIQPHGPYRLIGNCEGAFVAWELARQLQAAGERVDLVGILDTPNPQGFQQKPFLQRVGRRLSGIHPLRLLPLLPSLVLRTLKWARRQHQVHTTGDVSLNRPGTQMGWAFHPQSYDGHVCLFRCTQPGSSDFADLDIDDLHGWGGPAECLQLVSVPISRDELFNEASGTLLATEIEMALDRVSSLQRLAADD